MMQCALQRELQMILTTRPLWLVHLATSCLVSYEAATAVRQPNVNGNLIQNLIMIMVIVIAMTNGGGVVAAL